MVHETIQEEIANMDFTWIIHLENNVAVYDQNLLVLMSIKKKCLEMKEHWLHGVQ